MAWAGVAFPTPRSTAERGDREGQKKRMMFSVSGVNTDCVDVRRSKLPHDGDQSIDQHRDALPRRGSVSAESWERSVLVIVCGPSEQQLSARPTTVRFPRTRPHNGAHRDDALIGPAAARPTSTS